MNPLTQKILSFALRAGLTSPEGVKLLAKGVSTETYQVRDRNRRYVIIRFLDDVKKFQPSLVMKICQFFSKLGFPLPRMIGIGKIDQREAILFEYARGKVKTVWAKEDYEELGLLLGSLHYTQQLLDIQEPIPTLLDDILTSLNHLEDALPKEFNTIFDEVAYLKETWPTSLPIGVIHGDIWCKNLLHEEGKISALLGFTLPYRDCLIYDLGTIMKAIYFSTQNINPDVSFNALLEKYQQVRPLSQQEIESLPLMLRAKVVYTIIFMLEQASLHRHNRESFLSTAMFNLIKLNETKEISFEKISV